MATACRSWWRNCAMEADAEILAIDALEDRLGPLDADVTRIRELISTLELCHHKAERWIEGIIEAIGCGWTDKGLGTRSPGQIHPIETVWQNACAVLSAWCAGAPADALEMEVGPIAGSTLLASLGERSPLKEWQVQRVTEKVRSYIGWPQSNGNPATEYTWLLIGGGEYDLTYCNRCPERYTEHEDFWSATVRTIIRDTINGQPAELSLGLAIDMLWPCHWRFVEKLWLDVNHGGIIRKSETRQSPGGPLLWRSEIPELHEIDRIYLPAKLVRTRFASAKNPKELWNTPTGRFTITIPKETFRINCGLTQEDFQIAFPPGTRVYNAITDTKYTVGVPNPEADQKP